MNRSDIRMRENLCRRRLVGVRSMNRALYDHILCDGQCFLFVPSLRRDQRPGQMGFSPSRTTTSPIVYFQESLMAVQHPFPMVDYYNVLPRHLSSNSIALNFLLIWRPCYNNVLRSTLPRYDVASPPALRHICSRPNSSALN